MREGIQWKRQLRDVFALKMIEIAPLSPLDYGLDVDLFHKIATEEISARYP